MYTVMQNVMYRRVHHSGVQYENNENYTYAIMLQIQFLVGASLSKPHINRLSGAGHYGVSYHTVRQSYVNPPGTKFICTCHIMHMCPQAPWPNLTHTLTVFTKQPLPARAHGPHRWTTRLRRTGMNGDDSGGSVTCPPRKLPTEESCGYGNSASAIEHEVRHRRRRARCNIVYIIE